MLRSSSEERNGGWGWLHFPSGGLRPKATPRSSAKVKRYEKDQNKSLVCTLRPTWVPLTEDLSNPPGESSQRRDGTQVSHIAGDSLPAEPQGKPKNVGVGSLSLPQRIFATQGSNWGQPHCRRLLHQLSYQGIPLVTKREKKENQKETEGEVFSSGRKHKCL